MSDVIQRLRECIGEDPVASFARKSGIGESLMRKYLSGSEPSASNLARIAEVAGVTLDWLATGRGPKRRTDAQTRATPDISASQDARRWEKIIAIVEGIEDADQRAKALDELFARAQRALNLRQS